jgi:predicted  nucleic acid-binding Zn-ribbon protein
MNNEEKILEILEQHTKLFETIQTDMADMKTDISDLRDRVVKIEVTQENVVLPHLQALAEGQANLLATLAPKNRVEALEDEMAFMKSVIKALSQEVAELKKAQ